MSSKLTELKLIYKSGLAHFQVNSMRFPISIREDLFYGPALLHLLVIFTEKKKRIHQLYNNNLAELKKLNIRKFKVDKYEYSTGFYDAANFSVSRCFYRPSRIASSPLEEMKMLNELAQLELQGQIACCKSLARYFTLHSMLFTLCDYLEHFVRAVCFACIPSDYKFPDYYVLYLQNFGYVAYTNPKERFKTFEIIDITDMFDTYLESLHDDP